VEMSSFRPDMVASRYFGLMLGPCWGYEKAAEGTPALSIPRFLSNIAG
jgi:hypothetical protein